MAEAIGAELADDDVVEQLDAEDFAGLADPFGKEDFILTGRWITGRVIVADYDGSCRGQDGGFKELPRGYYAGGQTPD